MRWVLRIVGAALMMLGRGLRNGLVAIGALAFLGTVVAIADYSATQGSGTTFASLVISAKHYVAMVWCDATVGESQCATIKAGSSQAQTTDTSIVVQLNPNSPGVVSAISNATSGVGSSSTNFPNVSWLYGYNGTTWDQLQVDASKNLKVAFTGATSNASSAVATSGANLPTVGYLYGFNGTTWDQLQVDGSKNLKVALAANQSINQTQIGGTAIVADPCQTSAKTPFHFSISSSNTQIIAGTPGKNVYICSIDWVTSTASSISVIEGTGSSTCTGGTVAAVWGNSGSTAANGASFAANSGLAKGNGAATVMNSVNNNQNVCLIFTTGNTPTIAGGGEFVYQ